MFIFSWLQKQSTHIRHAILFCIIFTLVLGTFIAWHRLQKQPEIHDEAIIAATRPLLRVGIAHPFLEGLVREIGSSFVATMLIAPDHEKIENETNICDKMDIFFGISSADEWVKDLCGGNSRVALVFLDTYVQAQEKRIAGKAAIPPQSVYTTGYFWLSTEGAINMSRAIAQVLSSADSVHKVSYLDNAYAINHQLDDVYKKVKDRLYDMRNVWLVGWGDGWDAIADEYGGSIRKTLDITYDPSLQKQSIQELGTNIQKHTRAVVLTDATFPLQLFTKQYPSSARTVVTLDPWGDFSEVWSFSTFVEQNLLRVAQAL